MVLYVDLSKRSTNWHSNAGLVQAVLARGRLGQGQLPAPDQQVPVFAELSLNSHLVLSVTGKSNFKIFLERLLS